MRREECINVLGLVRRQIIGNDVNLLALGLVRHDVSEECDELGRRMARSCLAQHLAGFRIEGRIQRQRAVTSIRNHGAQRAPG